VRGLEARRPVQYRLKDILRPLWRGDSILRALEDAQIRSRARFHGLVLDVGAGWSQYGEMLSRDGRCEFLTLDLRTGTRPDVVGDLEKGLPLKDDCLDGIFLNNVLEHVARTEVVIREARRVLKPGGRFIFTVPFLMPVHRCVSETESYDDFWRFSDSAVAHLLRDFSSVDIVSCDTGPFVGGLAIFYYALKFRPLRLAAFIFMYIMDKLYFMATGLRKGRSGFSYPIVIYAEAVK